MTPEQAAILDLQAHIERLERAVRSLARRIDRMERKP